MVAVAEQRPIAPQVATALGRLIQFMSLEPGWDGESARAPDPTALRNAMLFLLEQIPAGLGPGFDGTIEMEWELPNRQGATVTFGPGEEAYLAVFNDERVLVDALIEDRADLADGLLQAMANNGR